MGVSVMAPAGLVIPEIGYCVHRKCGPEWVIVSTMIDFHDITYIVAGSGTYIVNGEVYPVTAGDILYIPPGNTRQAWTSHDNLIELYAVNFQLPGQVLPFGYVNDLGYDPKLAGLFTQMTRVWMEREEMYVADAGSVAMQIICELYRRVCCDKPVNRIDERVEKVKYFINENYNTELSLSGLARVAGLNPVYLGALFSRNESCTVKEYINKVRVQHAYEIIRTEKLSINDVALSCGYADAFYFSRVFKRYIGVSPSQVC
jgi:AraC-like DNA-binding protein